MEFHHEADWITLPAKLTRKPVERFSGELEALVPKCIKKSLKKTSGGNLHFHPCHASVKGDKERKTIPKEDKYGHSPPEDVK